MTDARTLHVTTPTDTELVIAREFAAPRRLVYEAFTRPELVRRWLGAVGGFVMSECEIDLRVGGTYRYMWRRSDRASIGVSGVYREVVLAERIVSTERFDESWYDGEAIATVVFAEREGRTMVTSTIRYASREVRDAVLKSPMERGVAAGYAALDHILATRITAPQ